MLWGAHVEYAQGPWIFRIGSGAINLDGPIQFGGLVEALRATGVPQSIALANDLDDKARKTWFNVAGIRSEEHTSETQPLKRISYAAFCLQKKTNNRYNNEL